MKSSTTCKKFTTEQQREADAEAENEKMRAEVAALEEEVAGWEAACHRAETGYGNVGPMTVTYTSFTSVSDGAEGTIIHGTATIQPVEPVKNIVIDFNIGSSFKDVCKTI